LNAAAELAVRAPAKVNLALEVLGRRPDGYHQVRTVIQAVSLCDELLFRPRPDGQVSLACDAAGLPVDERNLVVRAARMMQERFGVSAGAEVRLRKRIPVGAGLGGGSSDCAVTLLALRELWGLEAPDEALEELAARLGADVPFFLWGGAALCEGRGERVRPLASSPPLHYVLAMPPLAVSTRRVYSGVGIRLSKCNSVCDNVCRAIETGDAEMLGGSMRNDLQEAAFRLYRDLGDIWGRLQELKDECHGRGLLLSGSGSSFFGVFVSSAQAERAAKIMADRLGFPCAAVEGLPGWRGRFELLRVRRGAS